MKFKYQVIAEQMAEIRKEIENGDRANQPKLSELYEEWQAAKKSNQRLMTAVCRDVDR